MNITPRHLAAAQYTVIAVFVVASWYTLLWPWERAVSQLEFIFSPDHEDQGVFIWLAMATLLTLLVAITFWFKRAASTPLAPTLALLSIGLFVWAILWSDSTFIFNYGLGCLLAVFSWLRPAHQLERAAK